MTGIVRPRDLKPQEYYERYIRWTKNDFELIDFVFENGELDRVIETSDSDDSLLQTLYDLGSHPHMLNYIQNMGFEFVERVTHSQQEMTKTRAKMLWHKKKRG